MDKKINIRYKKEVFIILSLILLIFVWLCESLKGKADSGVICINEVCTNNLSQLAYDNEYYPDGYVELYNKSDMPVDISGWYISNEGRKLLNDNKIGSLIIEPYSYKVLAIDENGREEQNHIVLNNIYNMKNIALYDRDGELVDSVGIPELPIDVAYGRGKDGDDILGTQICTPGAANSAAGSGVVLSTLSCPVFSAESGFYAEEFSLLLSADPGFDIYYTLDGSIPTEKSEHYEGPIEIYDATNNENKLSVRKDLSSLDYTIPNELIDKATIVRAVCYDKKGNKSDIITKTFFVGEHMVQDYGSEIAAISIVADPDELVGYENGIMNLGIRYDDFLNELGLKEPEDKHDYYVKANFSERGRTAERNIIFSYYENGELKLEQSVGMRMRGVGSNAGPQKGFAIFPRKLYDGNGKMQYDIFQSSAYADKVVLKNSNIILRDGFFGDILKGRNLPQLNYRPVSVFINGEYWGLYTLFEKYDADYFQNYYGVDKDTVVIYKNGEVSEGKSLYEEELKDVKETAQTIYENPEVYDIVCDKIDIDSFIDYYCTLIYIDAKDNSETDNIMIWKTTEKNPSNRFADGRWRWVLYDLDFSMVDYKKDNMSLEINENRPSFFEQTLLNGLLDSEEFRIKFINTFMDMINFNFNPDRVIPLYMKKADEIEGAMENLSIRYPDMRTPWNEKTERDVEFWRERNKYVIEYLQEYFVLGDPVNMEINLDEGIEAVRINSSTVVNEGQKIEMQYFPGLPVRLNVIPKQGYKFKNWIISGGQQSIIREDETEIMPENNLQVTVVSTTIN